MKAIQVINPGKNSSLKISEVPIPKPNNDEILVKIEATALNRADLVQRAGNYPPPKGASNILGLEMAGTVVERGKDVTQWNNGDHVYGLLPGGGYAELCIIPEKMAIPLPENLSFEEAAAIPETFLTAWQCLKWVGKLQKEETILIHAGGSGVGTAAIQLARHLFDARILTTAGQTEKLNACKKLGADYAYDYHTQDFAKETTQSLGENSVDLIIDFIGAPYWQQNIDVLSIDGRVVYLSFLGGHKLKEISLAPLLKKRIKVMGSTLRSRSIDYKIDLTQSFLQATQYFIEYGTIGPVIDRVFNWENAEEAHRYMKDNRNTGKIVLTGM